MRLLILADIDDFHWGDGPGQADLLLACGGVYDQLILEAAKTFNCSKVFAVKGNHDFDMPFPPPIIDLHLRVGRHGRLTFGGLNDLWRYITVLAAEGERRGRRLLDQAMWVLLLAGIGFMGMALFAFGAAQWIESRLAVPGSGAMIIGMALMVIFLAIALARALRKEWDS
jgi:hypothetical protein